MRSPVDARATYERGKAARAAEVDVHERRSRTIGMARLLVAGVAIVLVGSIVWVPLPSSAWWAEAASVVLFGALVITHAQVLRRKERAEAALRFHERGLGRLDGTWTKAPQDGARFRTTTHPYTDDLDIFGPASLFQRVDATETRFGEERLATLLSRTDAAGWPDDVRARQDAVRDLAPRVAFRETLSALGALLGAEKPDPRPFLEWAEGSMPFPHGPALAWVARILPVVVMVLLAIGPAFHGSRTVLVAVLLVEVAITLGVRGRVSKIAVIVSSREAGLVRYGDMLQALEAEKLDAPLLVELQKRLASTGSSATREMRALGRILGFLDARHNEVFRFFIGPVLLWDLNCVVALERWRGRTGKSVRVWFDVLGEIEALASLAGFAFEHPSFAMPELAVDAAFDAKALGHPLLPDGRRVDNDVALAGAGYALIVTGSNMSGKSTLLRAMGINAALALAGAPVCATALRVGPVRLVTSMRVRDSLEEGVSHFYAELQKLKRVIDLARGGAPGEGTVLFLLDEILHGTNSRERILGARAIIRELIAREAMGAVSTHDLGISDLDREVPGRVENVHFQEQVEDDKMTFDYHLRRGIVQSSNALRLMKLVGIDVVSVEPERD